MLELDVSRRAAAARLAGLPLGVAPGRLEAAAAHGAADPEAPAEAWYARPWVYWTVGGLAATAALAGGGGNRESATYSARTGNACVLSGNAGDTEIPATCAPQTGDTGCVDGTACVACDNSVVTDDCRGGGWASRSGRGAPAPARDPVHEAWLDAGTGHMGDLLPR